MCIGIPMQVLEIMPGHALCEGRGERRKVNTALIDQVAAGDWLLVFLNDAREQITARRAAEVNATLDLVESAMGGSGANMGLHDAGFDLPSAMSAEQLRALTGQS